MDHNQKKIVIAYILFRDIWGLSGQQLKKKVEILLAKMGHVFGSIVSPLKRNSI